MYSPIFFSDGLIVYLDSSDQHPQYKCNEIEPETYRHFLLHTWNYEDVQC